MDTAPLEVNRKSYPVFISLEDRDKSTVSIGKKGVSIKVPQTMSRDEVARTIFQFKRWAKEQLEKNPPKEETVKEYNHGDKIVVGNKEYFLAILYASKQSSSARIKDNQISLIISSEIPPTRQKKHVSTLLSRIITRQRLPELEKKIKDLNEQHFKQNLNKIFFKNQKSRWGSCSEKGNINISTRLLFAPDEVLEYVCIHELTHLVEFNHSERFWSLVEKVMPNYKEREQWLKQNGSDLTF